MYSFSVKTIFPKSTMESLKREYQQEKRQQRMLQEIGHEAERAYRVRSIKTNSLVVNKYTKQTSSDVKDDDSS